MVSNKKAVFAKACCLLVLASVWGTPTSNGLTLRKDEMATARVYAPNAKAVSVVGDWNFFDSSQDKLASEGNGWWEGKIKGPKHGDAYKFVIWNDEQELWRNDPWSKHHDKVAQNSLAYNDDLFEWSDSKWEMPAKLSSLVFYELHVGTFCDTNPTHTPQGTFNDCLPLLDHLTTLGVNALLVMPVTEFNVAGSWGYTPSNFFAVDNRYGGPDAFKRFVNECHLRGLAVIVDVVYGHASTGSLPIWKFDLDTSDEWGGIYFYNDERGRTPWGNTRFNYEESHVREFIHGSAMRWLDTFHCDGLRLDGVDWIRNFGSDLSEGDRLTPNEDGISMLKWIAQSAKTLSPRKLVIAESYFLITNITSDLTSEGGWGFDLQYDPDFILGVRNTLQSTYDSDRHLSNVSNAVSHSIGEPLKRFIYVENHDEVANGKTRFSYEVCPGCTGSWLARKRTTLGVALMMTSPGVPLLFQGQEFLTGGWFSAEQNLDWSKAEAYQKTVLLYRDVIALRRNIDGKSAALMSPHVRVFHKDESAKILAFHRWVEMDSTEDQDLVVIVNHAIKPAFRYRIGFPKEGRWEAIFDSNSPSYLYRGDFILAATIQVTTEDLQGNGSDRSIAIDIAPYSCIVYRWSQWSQVDEVDKGRGSDLALLIISLLALLIVVLPAIVLCYVAGCCKRRQIKIAPELSVELA